MLETVEMWSDIDKDIVTWKVARVEEKDEGDNMHPVLRLTHKDEVQRYSPNTTEEELLRHVAAANAAKGGR